MNKVIINDIRYIIMQKVNKEIGIQDNLQGMGLDSLELVELIVEIELYFDIRFPNEILGKWDILTVEFLSRYVDEALCRVRG